MSDTFIKKRIKLSDVSGLKKRLRAGGLHTVCESALCPNIGECFARNTATFLICGNLCTRACAFCGVPKGIPLPLDAGEPARLASAVKNFNLSYVVITSVTRDDLADGGAGHFAAVIAAVRRENPGIKVEVLTPDFGGDPNAARTVFASRPEVFAHNLETVPSLYPKIRAGAVYERSLALLKSAADAGLVVKSGLMLGLDETKDETLAVMRDLLANGCAMLTLGQYLAPAKANFTVARHLRESEFEELKNTALSMGFTACAAGPYVRSSYRAEELLSGQQHTGRRQP